MERELKILVSKEIYEKILNSYEFSEPWEQSNTYYDTDDKLFKNLGGALRIRKIGNQSIFTMKIRKDSITLYEYEKEIDCDSIEDIKDSEILEWLKNVNLNKPVHEIAHFSTSRCHHFFENGELCLDKTTFRNSQDYEIEYEYTSDHDGIKVFNEILKPFGLEYKKNCSSKLARALND